MNAPLIELTGVGKSYGAGETAVEVLRGLCLRIHSGEYVAIVGASGSGKSTLMHILGCLDRPSEGCYRFAGRDIATLGTDELAALRRGAFGFVFQSYHLIPTETARENVEVPAIYAGHAPWRRRERAAALLSRLGLTDRLDHRPHQLSGGQQQRVSIARALMNEARVLLADEPTGALDTKSGTELMGLLDELAAEGHTIILITHDPAVAARARRIVEISDGQIVRDSGSKPLTAALRPLVQATPQAPTSAISVASEPPATFQRIAAMMAAVLGTSLPETLRRTWRVLWINRFRTSLTLLGIVIGVASVIVTIAVSDGARRQIIAQMGAFGTSILYVQSRDAPDGKPPLGINDSDLAEIARLPPVRRVMPSIEDFITIRHGNKGNRVYVLGTTTDLPSIYRWPVARGRFFNQREMRELAPVVVIGSRTYEQFFPDGGDPLGKQILIANAPFEVVGVMSGKGATSGKEHDDERIFVPYASALVRIYQRLVPDYVVIDVRDTEQVDKTERAVRALLIERHGQEDVYINNAGARLQAEMASRRSMTLMLALLAAVSLLVGGIGVMNVMLMTVKERTAEIGIRVATGARQSDIVRQFITEALMVSLVGGAVGAMLGLLIVGILTLANVPVALALLPIMVAFGCALITGVVFGIMPARQAARLDPVRALTGA
jgi:macrolide transport system ATP-binding/permease protein